MTSSRQMNATWLTAAKAQESSEEAAAGGCVRRSSGGIGVLLCPRRLSPRRTSTLQIQPRVRRARRRLDGPLPVLKLFALAQRQPPVHVPVALHWACNSPTRAGASRAATPGERARRRRHAAACPATPTRCINRRHPRPTPLPTARSSPRSMALYRCAVSRTPASSPPTWVSTIARWASSRRCCPRPAADVDALGSMPTPPAASMAAVAVTSPSRLAWARSSASSSSALNGGMLGRCAEVGELVAPRLRLRRRRDQPGRRRRPRVRVLGRRPETTRRCCRRSGALGATACASAWLCAGCRRRRPAPNRTERPTPPSRRPRGAGRRGDRRPRAAPRPASSLRTGIASPPSPPTTSSRCGRSRRGRAPMGSRACSRRRRTLVMARAACPPRLCRRVRRRRRAALLPLAPPPRPSPSSPSSPASAALNTATAASRTACARSSVAGAINGASPRVGAKAARRSRRAALCFAIAPPPSSASPFGPRVSSPPPVGGVG